MLRTRLWMGTVLVILVAGSLFLDEQLARYRFPFLFALLVGLGAVACYELLGLLEIKQRWTRWFCFAGMLVIIAANWLAAFLHSSWPVGPWEWVLGAFIACVFGILFLEMATFREAGGVTMRIGLVLLVLVYLGLLPSFLAQMRWLKPSDPRYGTIALALAIFVPKVCDIGAYFSGRFLGRHRMTPVLSPKKTWEGAAGGLIAAGGTAIALDRLPPVHWLHEDLGLEIAFGVSVGITAMLGDLAESMIKRDCGRKDASQVVPGFGGILDVVDSVIFAAPVVYLWLRLM